MKNLSIHEWMKKFDPLLKEQNEVNIKGTIILTDENFEDLTNAAFKIKDSVELLSSGEIGRISAIDLDDETVLVYVGEELVTLDVFDIKHNYEHFWEQNHIWRIADSELAQWIINNVDSVSNCGFRIGQDLEADEVFIGYSDLQMLTKAFDLMYAVYGE